MPRTLVAVACCSLVALSIIAWRSDAADSRSQKSAKLAGTRPVVEAADYATLQAAIDALPAAGGVVRLPPGKFEITEPLVLETEDVLIDGAGTATCIHNANTDGKSAIIIRPKSSADGKPVDPKARLWRVQLSNLRLTGTEKSGHGIEAIRVNEIFLDGITVSYHGGDGIRLDNCYEDPRVSNSLITYNKQAGLMLIANHDIVVSGNHFEENQDAVRCVDGFNLCMSGNNVDDHLRHGVVIENTYGSIVCSNMIEECQGTAIILDRDCYGITLSANVIAHEVAGGIELLDAHGCTVSANTFVLVHDKALYIGPDSGRITVTGNTFCDDYIGGGQKRLRTKPQPSSGIILDGTTDITIAGNTFSGLDTKALTLAGKAKSQRVNFSNNVLVGVASDHEELAGSHVADNLNSEGKSQ